MPLTPHGQRMQARLQKEYGSEKKGTSVFYAMIQKGKIKGAEGRSHIAKALDEERKKS
jgi:hypothetical protein